MRLQALEAAQNGRLRDLQRSVATLQTELQTVRRDLQAVTRELKTVLQSRPAAPAIASAFALLAHEVATGPLAKEPGAKELAAAFGHAEALLGTTWPAVQVRGGGAPLGGPRGGPGGGPVGVW